MKAGVKTSEFWMTLIVAAVGLLVTVGVLTPEIAATLNDALAQALVAITGLVVALIMAVSYARGRTALKVQNPGQQYNFSLEQGEFGIEPLEDGEVGYGDDDQ